MRPGRDRRQDARGDADIHQHDVAREHAPRQQQMAGLLAEEGHGHRRRRRCAAHRAAGAVEPARHVDGDDRQSACRHRLDRRARGPLDSARQARAEDGIDDQPGAAQQLGAERQHRIGPQRRVIRGIAPESGGVAEQAQPHRPAGFGQVACRDEAVAAIIAGAAQHRDRARRPALEHRLGDGAAGGLHQLHPGDAAGDRRAVRQRHLRRRQQGIVVGARHPATSMAPPPVGGTVPVPRRRCNPGGGREANSRSEFGRGGVSGCAATAKACQNRCRHRALRTSRRAPGA